MTPASIDRIQASFNRISPHFDRVAARFYERLFAADPSTRHLFTADLTSQAGHLAAALALIVRNLPMLDALEQPLNELGVAHALIGVRPAHYPIACQTLLLALEETLGGLWTTQLAADWERLLTLIAGHLIAGTRALHDAPTRLPSDPRA